MIRCPVCHQKIRARRNFPFGRKSKGRTTHYCGCGINNMVLKSEKWKKGGKNKNGKKFNPRKWNGHGKTEK